MLKPFLCTPRRYWSAVPAVVAVVVLAHAALSADRNPYFFPELPLSEIEDIAAVLDNHCEVDAASSALLFASYGGLHNDKEVVSEIKEKIFKICREAAAVAALQYSAALNRAKRERL